MCVQQSHFILRSAVQSVFSLDNCVFLIEVADVFDMSGPMRVPCSPSHEYYSSKWNQTGLHFRFSGNCFKPLQYQVYQKGLHTVLESLVLQRAWQRVHPVLSARWSDKGVPCAECMLVWQGCFPPASCWLHFLTRSSDASGIACCELSSWSGDVSWILTAETCHLAGQNLCMGSGGKRRED